MLFTGIRLQGNLVVILIEEMKGIMHRPMFFQRLFHFQWVFSNPCSKYLAVETD